MEHVISGRKTAEIRACRGKFDIDLKNIELRISQDDVDEIAVEISNVEVHRYSDLTSALTVYLERSIPDRSMADAVKIYEKIYDTINVDTYPFIVFTWTKINK